MNAHENPQLFACEYVRLDAGLKDGRRMNWTHWVPNKAVDDLFGIASDEPYQNASEFEEEKSRSYMTHGIYILWDSAEEELIPPENILQLSTEIEKREFTISEIVKNEVHLRDPHNVSVRPQRKRPTLQQAVDAVDEMLGGKLTLNDFFRLLQRPSKPSSFANTLLRVTHDGYESVADATPINLRTLVEDDVLFGILEIRRRQLINGIM